MKKEITPMKTSVTMNSTDRDLFGTRIRQETGTEMLCLTDLMEAYTQARVKNKWPEKNITEILTTSHNDETIYYLLYEQGKVKLAS